AIEAALEDLDIKRRLFQALDTRLPASAIISSNTSSISITALGAATRRPEQVLGMHFMNPPPLMPLVELVRGQATSEAVMQTAADLCTRLGKNGVEAADYPGFIANRILMPMLKEAFFAVRGGVAAP